MRLKQKVDSNIAIPMYKDQLWCSSETCKNYDCFRNPWNIPFGTNAEGDWIFYLDGEAIVWNNYEETCKEYRTYWKKKPSSKVDEVKQSEATEQ